MFVSVLAGDIAAAMVSFDTSVGAMMDLTKLFRPTRLSSLSGESLVSSVEEPLCFRYDPHKPSLKVVQVSLACLLITYSLFRIGSYAGQSAVMQTYQEDDGAGMPIRLMTLAAFLPILL